MSEINERWARDQWQAKKGAAYLAALAVPLWTVSYQMSEPIYTMPQWQWFSAVSIFSLLAAIGCSVGAACCVGFVLTNEKPLSGSNY
jgi:protein-S-isoprenylcysteine O-methyltransferase Ste14